MEAVKSRDSSKTQPRNSGKKRNHVTAANVTTMVSAQRLLAAVLYQHNDYLPLWGISTTLMLL